MPSITRYNSTIIPLNRQEEHLSQSRLGAVDNARLVCLLLVLYCHIPPASGWFHNVAYCFHVPIFFLFSGMFFQQRAVTEIISRSVKTLLVPYLVFNTFLICFYGCISICSGRFNISSIIFEPFLGMVFGSTASTAPYKIPGGPSWFLLALFLSRLMLIPLLQGRAIIRIMLCILYIAAFFLLKHLCTWTLFSISSALLGLPFILSGFYGGNALRKMLNLGVRQRIAIAALCGIFMIPLALMNGTSNMFEGGYGNSVILFLIAGIDGSIFILMVCSLIRNNIIFTKLIVAGSTLFISCHMTIIEYVMLFYRRIIKFSGILMTSDKLLIAAITVVIMVFLIKVIQRYIPALIK